MLLIPVIMVLSVLLLLKVSDLQLSSRLFKGQCEFFNSKGVEENDIFHGSLFVVSTILLMLCSGDPDISAAVLWRIGYRYS